MVLPTIGVKTCLSLIETGKYGFWLDLTNDKNEKTTSKIYYRPTQDALDLVAYLSSLKGANYPLDEAPIYQPFSSSITENANE